MNAAVAAQGDGKNHQPRKLRSEGRRQGLGDDTLEQWPEGDFDSSSGILCEVTDSYFSLFGGIPVKGPISATSTRTNAGYAFISLWILLIARKP